ncbi:uncharacterized protein RBU57_002951 [Macrochelys suwanniensis]
MGPAKSTADRSPLDPGTLPRTRRVRFPCYAFKDCISSFGYSIILEAHVQVIIHHDLQIFFRVTASQNRVLQHKFQGRFNTISMRPPAYVIQTEVPMTTQLSPLHITDPFFNLSRIYSS